MKVSKRVLAISVICGMFLLYTRCVNSFKPGSADVRGEQYAGSASCQQCHKETSNSYQHTNHFSTSWIAKAAASKVTVGDSFMFDKSHMVRIEKVDTVLSQAEYVDGKLQTTKNLDVGFGSGEKASSFGYWQDDQLFQLPLSFFTPIHGWANSPGFPAHRANFQRPIIRRCFECHSSYVAEVAAQAESITQVRKLDRTSIIYGIDCERCHGPAASHVNFQTNNPAVKEARYITRWAGLSRKQKIDACGVCHAGNDLATMRSTFDFKPGDTLSKFYYPEFAGGITNVPDVHGKQVQLLESSRCFIMNAKLECSSCHNVHEAGFKNLDNYSKQCTGCHQQSTHDNPLIDVSLSRNAVFNCIDCHMPNEPSKLISYQVTGEQQTDPYLLRTHRIAIYLAATEKILAQMKALTPHQTKTF